MLLQLQCCLSHCVMPGLRQARPERWLPMSLQRAVQSKVPASTPRATVKADSLHCCQRAFYRENRKGGEKKKKEKKKSRKNTKSKFYSYTLKLQLHPDVINCKHWNMGSTQQLMKDGRMVNGSSGRKERNRRILCLNTDLPLVKSLLTEMSFN